MAPDQFAILPIADRLNDYAEEIKAELAKFDIRGIVDDRSEGIGRKIRDTELKKIPFMLIIGDNEKEANNVSVFHRKHVIFTHFTCFCSKRTSFCQT